MEKFSVLHFHFSLLFFLPNLVALATHPFYIFFGNAHPFYIIVLLVQNLFLLDYEVLELCNLKEKFELHLAEVSDQNFMDDGLISEKRSSIIGGKRKLGTAMIHDSSNDQVWRTPYSSIVHPNCNICSHVFQILTDVLNLFTFQLVPSRKPLIIPISNGNHALLSTNSECSRQTSEVTPSSLLSDAKELLCDDEEVNS